MKKPFKFEYNRPSLDWFEVVKVEIKENDYTYFRLERRFGPSWWLIGSNTVDEPNYHWKDTTIGQISERDILRFMEWAKTDYGSRIIEVKAISGSFNIFEEIEKLLNIR